LFSFSYANCQVLFLLQKQQCESGCALYYLPVVSAGVGIALLIIEEVVVVQIAASTHLDAGHKRAIRRLGPASDSFFNPEERDDLHPPLSFQKVRFKGFVLRMRS
jgi:hypothetical protein